MTLHWWMHWFWITRYLSVAPQLVFLLAAVHAVPLPGSTLDPQVHAGRISRTPPATSWVSGNDRPTSVYDEQHRQTEVGPVWSSSPDIEEPFYPTTVSTDYLLNRDLPIENIPVTSKTKTDYEMHTKNYPSKNFEKSQVENGNPSQSASQYFSDQLVYVHRIGENDSSDNLENKEPWISHTAMDGNGKISAFEGIHSSSEANNISTTPKSIENNHQNSILLNVDINEENSTKQLSNHSVVNNSSNSSEFSLTHKRKVNQRLVIRDLSNVSDSVFSSVSASHGSNSKDIENTSRPSSRASKAIDPLSHLPASLSSDAKEKQFSDPVKVEHDEKAAHVLNTENKTSSQDFETTSDSKTNTFHLPIPYTNTTEESINSFLLLKNHSRSQTHENKTEQINNKRTYLENNSSKTVPELFNKSFHNINVTSDRKMNVDKEIVPVKTSNSFIPSVPPNTSTVSNTDIANWELQSSKPSVPFDSSMSEKITTLSDTEESGHMTPVHGHEFIGRSASLSHDSETTIEPSVAPVSRSRIAASPQEIPHSGLDATSITGIALGIVVFAGLAGVVSFILYRRRYLNKPQTLNDKCSNPDSSGYIDDSTLRDNSEEMYSLDNDSFLNSLEAMTIQNYWTDNVKHTKL